MKQFILATLLLSVASGQLRAEAEPDTNSDTNNEPSFGQPAENENSADRDRFLGRLSRSPSLMGLAPLLRVESIRQELKIDQEQSTVVEEISISIQEDFGAEILSFLRSLRDLPPEERREARGKKSSEFRQKINLRLKEVLNDEQFNRLEQIGLQLDLRQKGAAEALTSEDLVAALDLTEDQTIELQHMARESRQNRRNEKAPTLEEAREATKEVLTEDQQEKLSTLLGDEFDLPEALIKEPTRRGLGRWRNGPRANRRSSQEQESPGISANESL